MPRAMVILLLSSLIWVHTPVAQLLKVYTLVEHYHEHKDENKDLGVWDFLAMHYTQDTDDHPGHDRDMQLPFKQCSHVASFALIFFEQVQVEIPQQATYVLLAKPLSRYNAPHHAAEAFSKIWQPPRA